MHSATAENIVKKFWRLITDQAINNWNNYIFLHKFLEKNICIDNDDYEIGESKELNVVNGNAQANSVYLVQKKTNPKQYAEPRPIENGFFSVNMQFNKSVHFGQQL